MDDIEKARLERDLMDMRNSIKETRMVADHAANSISTHEQVCVLRYDTITRQLQDIPRIFTALGSLQRHVYIGVGIMMAIGTILEILHK